MRRQDTRAMPLPAFNHTATGPRRARGFGCRGRCRRVPGRTRPRPCSPTISSRRQVNAVGSPNCRTDDGDGRQLASSSRLLGSQITPISGAARKARHTGAADRKAKQSMTNQTKPALAQDRRMGPLSRPEEGLCGKEEETSKGAGVRRGTCLCGRRPEKKA